MVLIVAVALEAVTGLVIGACSTSSNMAARPISLWLGFGYLTSRQSVTITAAGSEKLPGWRQALSGFLVLWGNPKALLFFGAFLPQFVDPLQPALPQVLVLGLIEMGAALPRRHGLYRSRGHRT